MRSISTEQIHVSQSIRRDLLNMNVEKKKERSLFADFSIQALSSTNSDSNLPYPWRKMPQYVYIKYEYVKVNGCIAKECLTRREDACFWPQFGWQVGHFCVHWLSVRIKRFWCIKLSSPGMNPKSFKMKSYANLNNTSDWWIKKIQCNTIKLSIRI